MKKVLPFAFLAALSGTSACYFTPHPPPIESVNYRFCENDDDWNLTPGKPLEEVLTFLKAKKVSNQTSLPSSYLHLSAEQRAYMALMADCTPLFLFIDDKLDQKINVPVKLPYLKGLVINFGRQPTDEGIVYLVLSREISKDDPAAHLYYVDLHHQRQGELEITDLVKENQGLKNPIIIGSRFGWSQGFYYNPTFTARNEESKPWDNVYHLSYDLDYGLKLIKDSPSRIEEGRCYQEWRDE